MYITQIISIVSLKIFVEKASGSPVAPSKLLVTRIGPCYGINLPISVSEMAITRKQSYFTVSGQLNISVDVASGWSIKGTMQKCHDIRNLDTCDHYRSLTVIKSGCDGENEGDQRQHEKFVQYVTPRMECPLQAGVYQISNFPFLTDVGDLTAGESKISTSVFGYTYRLDGFDEDYQKIMCVDAFLKHIYVRKHNWISNQKVTPVELPSNNHTAIDAVVKNNNDNDDDDEGQNDDSEVKTEGKHVNNEANDDKQEESDTKDVKQEDDEGNQDENAKDTDHDDGEEVNNEAAKDAQNDYQEEGVKSDDNLDKAKDVQHKNDEDGVKTDGNYDVKNEANEIQNEGDVNADDSEDAKNNEDKDIQSDDDAGDIKNNNNEDVTPSDAEDVKNVDGDANDAETEAPNTQSDDENDEENEE